MRIILLSLFSLWLTFVCAQTSGEDIIYLKNGSILHGTIMEKKANGVITLRISEGTLVEIASEDVKSTFHKAPLISKTEMPKKDMRLNYDAGRHVYKLIQLRGGQAFTSLAFSVGYKLKNHSFGAGAALQPYANIGAVAPVFAEYRYEIGNKEKRIKPFCFGQVGYGFALKEQTARRDTIQGGLYWNVGIGYKEYTARRLQWIYGIGFSKQYTHEIWDERITNWNPNTGEPISTVVNLDVEKVYNRLIVFWGILF